MPPRTSRTRRRRIIRALANGTVPESGLGLFAVGMGRFEAALDEALDAAATGEGVFKAVRGEYGSGKTFFARWLAERAHAKGMATSEVQFSPEQTPLHRFETVYRAVVDNLAVTGGGSGAFATIVDSWLLTLEDDAAAIRGPAGHRGADEGVDELIESRLKAAGETAPEFALALRGYRRARLSGDHEAADALLAWLSGSDRISTRALRSAGLKGRLDPANAHDFLRGLLLILRDSGHTGLLLVLDEIETLQRARSDSRDRGLNALRQLIDDLSGGGLPHLFLVITGTPAFYDGPNGVQRLAPLAQRLDTDFATDARYDTARATQIRLTGMDAAKLAELGRTVRDLFAAGHEEEERIRTRVDDAYVADLAAAVAGRLGTGAAPRMYLRKLVADVLYRVAEFPDFDPRRDYAKVRLAAADLNDDELHALTTRATSADEIDLDL
ncbi:BREX system ATP-binding protein BrxD [Actinomadura parmotrematis]|uniref:BREX system ATP-binding protein BrxD n=1 Tax=Actinomadura parmotrematis TaxID=2864039 RepID=A0ABS7G0Y2_9ACTN|nr:BREX system ATP-binding protein BrxD [Actinomadura parmotrematis]MBW8485529.1 BREX system ATP-binding protein BrxD [Actinomadura parmotrematis]